MRLILHRLLLIFDFQLSPSGTGATENHPDIPPALSRASTCRIEHRTAIARSKRLPQKSPSAPAIRSFTFSARAHFLKSGGKLYEIPPQPRYSRFPKLRKSNRLQFQSHLRRRRV